MLSKKTICELCTPNLGLYYYCSICLKSYKHRYDILTCEVCENLYICRSCGYKQKISYNKKHNNNSLIYIERCLNCIINKIFDTNITTNLIYQEIKDILDFKKNPNCSHTCNNENTPNGKYIQKYFNDRCFNCLIYFIIKNYIMFRTILTITLYKCIILFKDDKISLQNEENITFTMHDIIQCNNKYITQKKEISNLLLTDLCEIKIVTLISNKRYDRFYNIYKGFDTIIIDFYKDLIIDQIDKSICKGSIKIRRKINTLYILYKQLQQNIILNIKDKNKYYLYCNVKTNTQLQIYELLQNLNTYKNLNIKTFENLYTIDQLHTLLPLITTNIKKNKYTYAITLDFTNAFINVSYDFLLRVLQTYIKRDKDLQLIKDHLTTIMQIFHENDETFILYLNNIARYLFKLCMYHIIENTLINIKYRDIQFYNLCDDFIFLSNDENYLKLFHTVRKFIIIAQTYGMKINAKKVRLYNLELQNLYFLNTVIYPSKSLQTIINHWKHIIYVPESNLVKNIQDHFNNLSFT